MPIKKRISTLIRDRAVIWMILFLFCLTFGYFNRVVFNSDDYYDLYSSKMSQQKLDFYFEDRSASLGGKSYTKSEFLSSDSSHIIVGDIDRDGFEDFLSVGRNEKGKNFFNLHQNNEGKNFVIRHDLLRPVWKVVGKNRIYTAALVDLDNDGWLDLVLVQQKNEFQQVTFLKNEKGKFKTSDWGPIVTVGDKRNINLLDVNADGFIDLYFSSFMQERIRGFTPLVSNGNDGGKNILLLNQSGLKFEDRTDEFGLGNRALSWTAALADFDQDGYVDLVDINDFGYNNYKKNINGKHFVDETKKFFNAQNVSYSMSGEVADFNNDGAFDIFISNVNRPTLFSGNNYLLMNNPKNLGAFKNVARLQKVDACGWSWGAKALEPNNDGNEAIFVVNAPTRSPNSALRSSFNSSPLFLRELASEGDDQLFSKGQFTNTARFPERNCLYYFDGNQFSDVAEAAGIKDLKGGKSVSTFDYNNDGVTDLLIGNVDSSPILYAGNYKGKNRWIGFKLIGNKSNRDAIGAVVNVQFTDREKKKQIFPTNGYQSQSSTRLIFGVKDKEDIKNIRIIWPSRKIQNVTTFNIGEYNEIYEEQNF